MKKEKVFKKQCLLSLAFILFGVSGSLVFADGTKADKVDVYRLYNTKNMEHLYTTDKNEYNRLPQISKDWKREGVNFQTYNKSQVGTKPVYRVYNPKSGEHILTSDNWEKVVLTTKYGWRDEKVSFYAPLVSTKPVYRVFNAAAGIGAHHLTADSWERKVLISKHQWKDEGVAFNAATANDSTHQVVDKTSINVKDSTLYVGDTWNAKDNFISATNASGRNVDFSNVKVAGTVDTSQVGTFVVSYTYGGKTTKAQVTVKNNQSTLNVKDSSLNIGDVWNAEDNFISATDKEGREVKFSEIRVEGEVDTSKVETYEVVYDYQGKIAKSKITVEDPSIPVNNGDGTVDFMNQTWDIMKDYGDGNVMIAGLEPIKPGNLPFVRFTSTGYYYQEDIDNLNGYDESLPKPLLDEWYNKNILGTSAEKYVQPVTPSNPTLGDMKQLLGWTSNTIGELGNDPVKGQLWRSEVMAPDKYPTLVGTGKKQAFLMSASDVVKNTDQVGHFTDEAKRHRENLIVNNVSSIYLRTPGEHVKATLMISEMFSNFMYSNYIESAGSATIPTLVVNIP